MDTGRYFLNHLLRWEYVIQLTQARMQDVLAPSKKVTLPALCQLVSVLHSRAKSALSATRHRVM
jgi:hypothetical protein